MQRENTLKEAVENLELYSSDKAILEFEFMNEEGTGLGPTLEYYTIIGEELQNPAYNYWRRTDDNLLFPNPIDPKEPETTKLKKKVKRKSQGKVKDLPQSETFFRCAGTFAARAIIDERVIDLPLHPVFWDLVLERVIRYLMYLY